MKVTVVVGSVEIRLDGIDLTLNDVRKLLRNAASVSIAVAAEEPLPEQPSAAIGFSAHVDLDPERNYAEDTSEWYE